MWQYAPKDKLYSVNGINLALYLAVLIFNKGHGLSISAIWKSVGIQFSQNILDQLNEIDSTRLCVKDRQLTEICKQSLFFILTYNRVSSRSRWQDSQSSYSLGKIPNVGGPELSEEKIFLKSFRLLSLSIYLHKTVNI